MSTSRPPETGHRIWDISPLVSPRWAVFPGDVAYRRDVAMAFEHGDHLALSSMTTTLHIGAHCDAPSHYHAQGATIEQVELAPYLGPCQVIHAKPSVGLRLRPSDLPAIEAPRVLLATGSFANPEQWRDDFSALSAELVDWLADRFPDSESVAEGLSELARIDVALKGMGVAEDEARPRGGARIGVLPMNCVGLAAEDAYLGPGLAEEITAALSRFRWMFVVASTSLGRHVAEHGSDAGIRRHFALDFLVDGTIQRGGDRIRINIKLLDLRAGNQIVWSRRFDRRSPRPRRFTRAATARPRPNPWSAGDPDTFMPCATRRVFRRELISEPAHAGHR